MSSPTVGLKRKGQRKLTIIDHSVGAPCKTEMELFDFRGGPHCRIYWKVNFFPPLLVSLSSVFFFNLWTNVGPMMDLSILFQQLVGPPNLNHVGPTEGSVSFLFSVHFFSYVWVITFLFAWFYIPSFHQSVGPYCEFTCGAFRGTAFFSVQFSSISAIFFF